MADFAIRSALSSIIATVSLRVRTHLDSSTQMSLNASYTVYRIMTDNGNHVHCVLGSDS